MSDNSGRPKFQLISDRPVPDFGGYDFDYIDKNPIRAPGEAKQILEDLIEESQEYQDGQSRIIPDKDIRGIANTELKDAFDHDRFLHDMFISFNGVGHGWSADFSDGIVKLLKKIQVENEFYFQEGGVFLWGSNQNRKKLFSNKIEFVPNKIFVANGKGDFDLVQH